MQINPGNTKLIELSSYKGNKIFAKIEGDNPSGSIKDRAVFFMLEKYKDDGKLINGSTIIEPTSGNTGISLAYYSTFFNYNLVIVLPESASLERRKMIERYGGKLVLVSGGMVECSNEANRLLKEIPNSFIFNQFENENNYLSHFYQTGPEIYNQKKDIDYIFAGFGTGGTISGIGKYFKSLNLKTKIIGIEPEQSPLITKGFYSNHLIQGIGANFVPNNLKKEYVDEFISVDDKKSIEYACEIRNNDHLDVGISSGAALLSAHMYIDKYNIKGKRIVVIFPDKGDRYSW